MSDQFIIDKIKQGVSGQVMFSLYGVPSKRVSEVRKKYDLPFKKTFGNLPWLRKGEKA